MSLSVDLWKVHQDLQDSLNRLECLQECHLQERPEFPLPDFLFPLRKVLLQALEEIPVLQRELQAQARPEVRLAVQALLEDPQAQELMARLAELELQDPGVAEARAAQAQAADWKAQAAAQGWAWVLGLESVQAEEKVSALVQAEEKVEVLEPGQAQDLDWMAQGRLTDL
jgi:hypothetical protein